MISYALTTRQRLIDFLELSSPTTTQQNILDRIIESVTEYVENYCSRRFKQTAYTNEIYDGNDSPVLLLKNYPINSSETFTLKRRTTALNEEDWETVDSENYFIHYNEGSIEYSPGLKFANYPRHYSATYTAGYSFDNTSTFLTDIGLGDLEYAVWKLCAAAWNRRKGDSSVKSERLLNYSVTYQTEAQEDPEIARILDKYTRLDIFGSTSV